LVERGHHHDVDLASRRGDKLVERGPGTLGAGDTGVDVLAAHREPSGFPTARHWASWLSIDVP
jgi:hypothetical protein